MHEKEFLDKIIATQEKISDDIIGIKVIQAKHDENLKEHMRRSDALENANKLLAQELEPIKKHVNHVDGALRALGALATIIGVLAGIVKILSYFSLLHL